MKATDGVALRTLAGRPAAICTFLPGVWPRRVRPEHCAPLGGALARLHVAGTDFAAVRRERPRPGRLGAAAGPLPRRRRCGAAGADRRAGPALAGILAAWPAPGALPTGQIHADLFPDNVFFLDGRGPAFPG